MGATPGSGSASSASAEPLADLTCAQLGDLSHRRDCHFDDPPFAFLLKQLLKGEGGAAE